MPLAIFDLDGTLTQTTGVDDACFVTALGETLGLRGFDTNWANYAEATDEGLLDGICRLPRSRGGLEREPTLDEALAVRRRFLELLNQAALSNPARFRAVEGAAAFLGSAIGSDGWSVAIATGAWKESAELKLRTAGMGWLLDAERGVAAAFAGRETEGAAAERARILSLAIGRATERAGVRNFAGVVYVGDGVWDLRAARTMGIGFVGLAVGDRREQLLRAGAGAVLPDFGDAEAAMAAVTRAAGRP